MTSLRTHCALLATTCSLTTWAANGTQPGGYGIKNAMMGGSSIALPLDASAAANRGQSTSATPPKPSAKPIHVDPDSRLCSTTTAISAVNKGCSAPISAMMPAGMPCDMAHQLGPR